MGAEIISQRFRIISRLGEGGMGVTYRAWDEFQGRPVVVKQPHRSLLSTPGILERFEREIRALKALSNPHIVPIIDHGLHDGVPFVAMRFLPGGSLSNRRLRSADGAPRPHKPATLHLWLPAIAAALDFIHAHGVVHRDVKPTNIFFDAWWGAFVGDFGIAKVVAETSSLAPEHTLTGTNMALGTLDYMAPEFLRPQGGIDGRADQYALAIVVYEMLAARKPFRGERAHLIVEHASFPPAPLATLVSGLPTSLQAAVHRGLAKQPEDRFTSCADFATAALCDVPPLAEIDGYARLLCPKCETILKLPPNAENQLGFCTRCKAGLSVAAGFEALWLPQEAAAVADLPTPSAAEWPEATPIPPGVIKWRSLVQTIADAVSPRKLLELDVWRSTKRRHLSISTVIAVLSLLTVVFIGRRINTPPRAWQPLIVINSAPPEFYEEFEDLEEQPIEIEGPARRGTERLPDTTQVEDIQIVSDARDVDLSEALRRQTDFQTDVAPGADLIANIPTAGSGSGTLACRTDPKLRLKLVQAGGGNAPSEAAVEAGLKWIVNHQSPDGSWDFDFTKCPNCGGNCSGIGSFRDRGGATALALLPILGRGYTHKEGPYKKQVEAGIGFLVGLAAKGQGKAYEKTGSLYSQGLAGIALSEAYAMSEDKRLAAPAQSVLNYIMAAQDPLGGGWRYKPKEPGDTSATGWQLTALHAGHEAFLQVSPLTIKKAVEFLNHVAADDGASYGYTEAGNAPGTSAVGLLCRMRMGWKKDNPAIQRGAMMLARSGPDADLYFDYYATQVLHHMEGDVWVRWNTKMRDMLITSQQKNGHAAGSWWEGFENGPAPAAGGRLYTTAMATMILEAYYRHPPLYGREQDKGAFKE